MKKLNIAVIGVGSWGKNHARVFKEMEKTNLVGIYDVQLEKAKDLAKIHRARAFSDLEELLSMEEIDAISIASPTSTHGEIALKAIQHGKHVLIEKPMTSTLDEAEKIIDASKATNVIVSVGFIERFNPIVSKSKNLIESGELGELVLLSARRLGPYWPDRLKDVDVIRDVSIHDIDAFRYLTEKDPVSVYARGGKLRHSYLDYAEMLLDFGGGLTGFVESNYLTPHRHRKLMLTCEHGIVEADYMTQEYVIEDNEWLRSTKSSWQEPLTREMNAFADACLENTKPIVTAEDGIKALKIALASIESIETNKIIDLDF
ncbi:MAG: Gfo/Idh/MocA family oxidoreductase [Candidatus Heimdallarchaeota archaeon]|nr:Gfo/Idh/MocA family oxidoreductase [Candidatus Heimdallarchaeota archaeon]